MSLSSRANEADSFGEVRVLLAFLRKVGVECILGYIGYQQCRVEHSVDSTWCLLSSQSLCGGFVSSRSQLSTQFTQWAFTGIAMPGICTTTRDEHITEVRVTNTDTNLTHYNYNTKTQQIKIVFIRVPFAYNGSITNNSVTLLIY